MSKLSNLASVRSILLVLSTLVATPAFAQYSFSTINFPGAVWTQGSKINDAGQVVGYYLDTHGVRHGFLFTAGAYTTIDCPSPYTAQTIARGINNLGQVVGDCEKPGGINNFYGAATAFLWQGGTFTLLPEVPGSYGGASTSASDINDLGQIVGFFTDSTLSNDHGFILNGGTFTTFDVPGYGTTVPEGTNKTGQIVGYAKPSLGSTVVHGFLLSGSAYTVFDPPGSTNTEADGISPTGEIVGTFSDASGQHGYVLSGGVFTTVNVPGAQSTSFEGMNTSGQIVGGYALPGGNVRGLIATSCEDKLTLSFSAGTLDLGFTLLSGAPATWSTWFVGSGTVLNLWSLSIPAILPAVSFTVPISGIPPIGSVGILTAISTPARGLQCWDFQVVDTSQR